MADGNDVGSQVSRKSAKDRAREAASKTKGYISEKVPQQRREQGIWRLKKMVMEIQGHADCKFSLYSLVWDMLEDPLANCDLP